MFIEDRGDSCLQKFPVERLAPEPNEVPYIASVPETVLAFRRAVGYDLRFERFHSSTPDVLKNKSVEESRQNACFKSDETLIGPFDKVERFAVVDDSKKKLGELVLRRSPELRPQLDWNSACELVESLSSVLSENYSWRAKLAERESELALCAAELDAEKAPVYTRAKTSTRLRDILRVGARALGAFDAASLCVLDSATTSLKTRVVWGLPDDRYLEPPRPLRGARAEIEALTGNAVVLNDDDSVERWKAPEDFPCSVCVPVVSETTILGVLWFFSNIKRRIGVRELETLGLISGRVVDALERESLCSVCSRSKKRETEESADELERFVDALVAKRRDRV